MKIKHARICIWYVTQFIHRHMRQEDNGPNLFTLLKKDIFKNNLHLEGVLMEYFLQGPALHKA